ncbi:hypothetical protein JCM9279_000343 [Rhodotorula babjevae]
MASPAPPDRSPSVSWPVGDDLRTSWQDLLLHTRLAALREGLTRTAYAWDDDARQFDISSVGGSLSGRQKRRNDVRRVDLEAHDGGWPVDSEGDDESTRTWTARRRSEGTSSSSGMPESIEDDEILTVEFLRRRTRLQHGQTFNFADLCAIEAKLHAASRRQGKYLEPAAMMHPSAKKARTRLRCALEPVSCVFSVVLEVQVGECKARCVELQPDHSCTTEVPPPSASLSAMLDYFGQLSYVLKREARVLDPVSGLTVNRRKLKTKQRKLARTEKAAQELQAREVSPGAASAEAEEPEPRQSARLAALKKAASPRDKTLEPAAGRDKKKSKAKIRSAARAERWKQKHGGGGQ